jgi:hypothetical protein
MSLNTATIGELQKFPTRPNFDTTNYFLDKHYDCDYRGN